MWSGSRPPERVPRALLVAWQTTPPGRGRRIDGLRPLASRGRRRQRVEAGGSMASGPPCRVADDTTGSRPADRVPRAFLVAWQTTPAGRGRRIDGRSGPPRRVADDASGSRPPDRVARAFLVAWQTTPAGRGHRIGRLGPSLSRGRRRYRVEAAGSGASGPPCRVADDAAGSRPPDPAPQALPVAWQTTLPGRGRRIDGLNPSASSACLPAR